MPLTPMTPRILVSRDRVQRETNGSSMAAWRDSTSTSTHGRSSSSLQTRSPRFGYVFSPSFSPQSSLRLLYQFLRGANLYHQAVNELKGRIFNGNSIEPRFYDAEKFEKGEYR